MPGPRKQAPPDRGSLAVAARNQVSHDLAKSDRDCRKDQGRQKRRGHCHELESIHRQAELAQPLDEGKGKQGKRCPDHQAPVKAGGMMIRHGTKAMGRLVRRQETEKDDPQKEIERAHTQKEDACLVGDVGFPVERQEQNACNGGENDKTDEHDQRAQKQIGDLVRPLPRVPTVECRELTSSPKCHQPLAAQTRCDGDSRQQERPPDPVELAV